MTPHKTDPKPHKSEHALIEAFCGGLISALLLAFILAAALYLFAGCSTRKTASASASTATSRTEQHRVESARTKLAASDSSQLTTHNSQLTTRNSQLTTRASKTIDIARDSAGRPSRISITESGQTRKAAAAETTGRSETKAAASSRSDIDATKMIFGISESETKTNVSEKKSEQHAEPLKTTTVIMIVIGSIFAAWLMGVLEKIFNRNKQ